jgi:peptidoglycan-N-acetylglucosamine deacetylase
VFEQLLRPVVAVSAAAVLVLGFGATAAAAPAPPDSHTVERGDTLSEIADWYDVSLRSLLAENGLDSSSLIHPGDELRLPSNAAPDERLPVEEAEAEEELQEDDSSPGEHHTVRSGDTLSEIADSYDVSLRTLYELNGLDASSVIHPDDVILLPGGSGGEGASRNSGGAAGSSLEIGPNDSSRVVLTFDDCPSSLQETEDVLAFAERSDIGLVIAPTGDCISMFQSRYGVDLAEWARANGQYVINHSVSHRDLTTLNCDDGAAELGEPGVVTNFGRPPYGALNSAAHCAYAQRGMSPWLWTVDTRDWTGKSEWEVVASVVEKAEAGDTVLMHLQWNGFSPSAIGQMRDGLAERGLELCRAHPGTSPVDLPASLPC